MNHNRRRRFESVVYDTKNVYLHYDGEWPRQQPVCGFSFLDYMNGKEVYWPKYDVDTLNMLDLLHNVYEYIDGIDGHHCDFQYLESGFLCDVVDDKGLLKFWNESDQDVPNEVHLFMTHEGPLKVVPPGEPTWLIRLKTYWTISNKAYLMLQSKNVMHCS
ncbi:hypothetical protein C5167_004690 [Papaver somniferum]|uniref:Uncharacterized protein n=1 Tax=Papaver somniferum TaxID=3469 RepID=A0A4Y7JBE8_PAPSO|nr:uncharacterized protein LOC113273560 [Papaver somniferum]RZC57392.1 hypothetical protein C5167_004690 [Papaver somniferum]